MTGLAPVSFRKGRDSAPRLSPKREAGKTSARFWTEEQREILRQYYPTHGAGVCQARLPGRSIEQIYRQAKTLGLRVLGADGTAKPNESHPVSDELDDRIRAAWPELKGRGAVARLAAELGLRRWWLSKRARSLGLTTVPHRKEPLWSAAEDELMTKVPLHDPDAAAKIFRAHGFRRSPTAIIVRATRLGLSRRYRETFSATAAAEVLGMDAKTISTWCVEGAITAGRRDDNRLPQQGGSRWEIKRDDLRRFVLANLERIDIRRVEMFAFVDLIAGGTDV